MPLLKDMDTWKSFVPLESDVADTAIKGVHCNTNYNNIIQISNNSCEFEWCIVPIILCN